MSALTHGFAEIVSGDDDGLLEAFLALDTPEGFKAELIEGEIVVTPPPDGNHEIAIGRLLRQVVLKCPQKLDFAPGKGLIVPDGRFIPDGTFAEWDAFRDSESWSKPQGVLMVVEVTSRRPEKDRDAKRRGYAGAEIPLYLLVDRQRNTVTLFSEPEAGDYSESSAVPVGEALELPAPFGFALDTGDLT